MGFQKPKGGEIFSLSIEGGRLDCIFRGIEERISKTNKKFSFLTVSDIKECRIGNDDGQIFTEPPGEEIELFCFGHLIYLLKDVPVGTRVLIEYKGRTGVEGDPETERFHKATVSVWKD